MAPPSKACTDLGRSGNAIAGSIPLQNMNLRRRFTVLCILSRVGVTYRTGSGLDDWIYCSLYIHNSGPQAIQRYRCSTSFTAYRYAHTRILTLYYSYPDNGFITVSLSLQITH
jgi:hypothetical protein